MFNLSPETFNLSQMLWVLFLGKLNVLTGSATLLQRRLQRFVLIGPYTKVFDAHVRKLCKRKYNDDGDDDDNKSIKTEVAPITYFIISSLPLHAYPLHESSVHGNTLIPQKT